MKTNKNFSKHSLCPSRCSNEELYDNIQMHYHLYESLCGYTRKNSTSHLLDLRGVWLE